MKNFLSFLLVLVSCLACGRQPPTSIFKQKDRLQNSTVVIVTAPIQTESEENTIQDNLYGPTCSGVFISQNLILTSAHCVDIGVPEILSRMIRLNPSLDEKIPKPIGEEVLFSTFSMFRNGEINDVRISTVVKFDRIVDLALLRVSENQEYFFREFVETRRAFSTREGDQVMTIGHPGGALWTLSIGRISALTSRDIMIISNFNYMQVDMTIWRGNSGGALVDENGFLIGICAMVRNDTRQSYFVKHSVVSDFLRRR